MAPEATSVRVRRAVFHTLHDKKLTREDFERVQARATPAQKVTARRRPRLEISSQLRQYFPTTANVSNPAVPAHFSPEIVQQKKIAINTIPSNFDISVNTNLVLSAPRNSASRLEFQQVTHAGESFTRVGAEEPAARNGHSEQLSSSGFPHPQLQTLGLSSQSDAPRHLEDVIAAAVLEKGLFVSSQSEDTHNLEQHESNKMSKGFLGLQSPVGSQIKLLMIPHILDRSSQSQGHGNGSDSDVARSGRKSSRILHINQTRDPRPHQSERREKKKTYRIQHRRHLAEDELVLVNNRPVSNTKGSDTETDGVDKYPFENSQDPISETDQTPNIIQCAKPVVKNRQTLSKGLGNAKIKKTQPPPLATAEYRVLRQSYQSSTTEKSRDWRLDCSNGFNELEALPTGRIAFLKHPRVKRTLPKELYKRIGKLTIVPERNFGDTEDASSLTKSLQPENTERCNGSQRAPFFAKDSEEDNDESHIDRELDMQSHTHRQEALIEDEPMLSAADKAEIPATLNQTTELEDISSELGTSDKRYSASLHLAVTPSSILKHKRVNKMIRRVTWDENREVIREFISVIPSKAVTEVEVVMHEDEETEDATDEEGEETEDEQEEEQEEEDHESNSADDNSGSSSTSSSNGERLLLSQEYDVDEDEDISATNDEGSIVSQADIEDDEDGEYEGDLFSPMISTLRTCKVSKVLEYVTPIQQRSRRIEEGGFRFEIEAFISKEKMILHDDLLFDEVQDQAVENHTALADPSFLVAQESKDLLHPLEFSSERVKSAVHDFFLQPGETEEMVTVDSGSQTKEGRTTLATQALERPPATTATPTRVSSRLHPTYTKPETQNLESPQADPSSSRASIVLGDSQWRGSHASPEIMDSQSPRV